MRSTKTDGGWVYRVAVQIVDKRHLWFLIYAMAILFCMFSRNWVAVENDVTMYLPEDTETRQGIVAMNENFESFATARIMVSNITLKQAEKINSKMAQIEGVEQVLFSPDEAHYKNAAALYEVNFSGNYKDPVSIQAMDDIYEMLAGFDVSADTMVGVDEIAMLHGEMSMILVVAVAIILLVLVLTSRAYAEVPVLLLTFGAAAILNMGTNFIFGKISFISDSVAVVLQLALAIDYAIILCHRFSSEHETKNARDACIAALTKAMPEIAASSLTTVSGLAALAFMKFSIGFDMSIVLIKSIMLSLLSVFTLMPGLLVLFSPLIDRTKHKKLLPNITFLGKFAVLARRVVPPLFVVLLVGAFCLSSRCPYCYSFTDIRTAKMSEQQMAAFKIRDTFGSNNMVALVVPSGDYEAEGKILDTLNERPEVKSTMGLAGIEIMDGCRLTDALTPREFSELVGLDYEVAQVLYSAYAASETQYGELLSGVKDYRVPLFDMFLFLKDQLETNNIILEGEQQEMMTGLLDQLESARKQLQNGRYSRMVVYLNLPEESQETFDFLGEIRDILGKYYSGDYYVVGNSTSSRDLSSSFAADNLIISVLSALFVILVLLFTFRSAGLPILLIVVIQGSIWINFSFPVLMDQPLYFLGYLIVSAIQMGANIDYAIVISSHYQEQKAHMSHKKAIVEALNSSFPTIFTSGSIMASAGLLIGNLSAQPVIAIMGNCLGRGTIISIVLVLVVLPSILVLGDSIIEHTRFQLKSFAPEKTRTDGSVRVRGHVRGYVTGMVDAQFDGVIHGTMEAVVSGDTREVTQEALQEPFGEGGTADE